MASQNIDIIIQAKDQASRAINGIRGSLGGLKSTIASAAKSFAVIETAIVGVGAFGLKSAGQIQQTKVAFENLYGSAEKAGKMMGKLSEFAKKTPFEFGELTDVALKLKNVAGIGDEELIPMLTNLGDIAASQAKPISQIVEAYNDAITGEFERLKEFGIKARQEGDNVTFTFKGQEQTVKKTSESIGEYLQSIGQAEGITGAMDKQSETLNGRLSTMKDQFKGIAMEMLGMSETGEIQVGGAFDRISKAVEELSIWIDNNGATISKYMQVASDSVMFVVKAIYSLGEVLGQIAFDITMFVTTTIDLFAKLKNYISEQITNIINLFFYLRDSIVKVGEEIYIGFSGWITSLVDSIKEKLDAVMNFVSDKVAQAKKILSNIASAAKEAVGNAASKVSSAVGARASGGAVTQNRAYLVGEQGRELFVPQTSGTIVPNASLGGGITINMGGVSVSNEADENRLVLKIKQELTRTMQLQRLGIS